MQQYRSSDFSNFSKIPSVGFSSLAIVLVLFLLSGCQTLQTRDDVRDGKTGGRVAPPVMTTPPLVTSTPDADGEGADALPTPPAQPPGTDGDTFLSKELPKIGLILGPGGLKSYAHIGVLREFARARLPIHAVAGLEWGALMGAFYSEKGLANDVDWKAFRLKEGDLSSSSVLRGYRARSMADFDSYLATVFPAGAVEKSKVPFGCPTVFRRDRLQILVKGSLKEVASRCLPYPPLLGPAGDHIAGVDAVEESAQWLRSKGANLIVLVNVLGAGEPLSGKLAEDQYGTSVMWTEVRRRILKVRAPTVNWIVSVNTVGKTIDDFDARRANVELGAKAATDLTTKLTKQYGF